MSSDNAESCFVSFSDEGISVDNTNSDVVDVMSNFEVFKAVLPALPERRAFTICFSNPPSRVSSSSIGIGGCLLDEAGACLRSGVIRLICNGMGG